MVTGVKLELGSVATPFETRPMQTELALCQRYYQRLSSVTDAYFATGVAISSTTFRVYVPYAQTFRALPTLSVAAVGSGEYGIDKRAATLSTVYYGVNSLAADFTSTSMTAGRPIALHATNDNAYIEFSSEL